MKLIALLSAIAFVAGVPAALAKTDGAPETGAACSLHKWGLKRALGLLSDPSNPILAGPDAVWTRASASAFFLELSPLSRTGILSVIDGARFDAQSPVGAVRLPEIAPGEYQISLTQPALIEVFQNGRIVAPKKSSEAARCRIAKSVRVELGRGDVVLRVSGAGAGAQKIGVAVERRPDQPKLRGPRN
jgi:hypothetical protein